MTLKYSQYKKYETICYSQKIESELVMTFLFLCRKKVSKKYKFLFLQETKYFLATHFCSVALIFHGLATVSKHFYNPFSCKMQYTLNKKCLLVSLADQNVRAFTDFASSSKKLLSRTVTPRNSLLPHMQLCTQASTVQLLSAGYGGHRDLRSDSPAWVEWQRLIPKCIIAETYWPFLQRPQQPRSK